MRTRMWASVVVVVFVIPLLAAQVEFGTFSGIVRDTSGTALPGVTVTLTGPDTRAQSRTLAANSRSSACDLGNTTSNSPCPDSHPFAAQSQSRLVGVNASRSSCQWVLCKKLLPLLPRHLSSTRDDQAGHRRYA